jgi:hypothetical protein
MKRSDSSIIAMPMGSLRFTCATLLTHQPGKTAKVSGLARKVIIFHLFQIRCPC